MYSVGRTPIEKRKPMERLELEGRRGMQNRHSVPVWIDE